MRTLGSLEHRVSFDDGRSSYPADYCGTQKAVVRKTGNSRTPSVHWQGACLQLAFRDLDGSFFVSLGPDAALGAGREPEA